MIYVVLGMHKSGTTLVSQILHHSGVNMGGADLATVRSSDSGHTYSRAVTRSVPHALLGSPAKYSLPLLPLSRPPPPVSAILSPLPPILLDCQEPS